MQPGVALIFAKPPRGGRAKTRLVPALGPDRAARLAQGLLRDTWELIEGWPGARPVVATTDPSDDHGLPPHAVRWDQGGGGLDRRLERMLARALQDAPWAMAMGADTPGVPVAHLERVARALRTHDAVVAPTRDGGFWALALRRDHQGRCGGSPGEGATVPVGLLDGIPWSSADTARCTVARLGQAGLSVATGPEWFDIDEASDLELLRERVSPAAAPHTFAALRAR